MFTTLARNWWVLALRGVLAVFFAFMAFLWPRLTLEVLVILFGAYALVNGVFALAAAVTGHGQAASWWALVLEGLIGMGVGILTLFWPGITALALLYLIAFWAITTGIFGIAAAIRLRAEIEGEWLLALSGFLSVLFGALLVVAPVAGALAVIWLIGAYALLYGILLLALAFRLRSWSQQSPTLRGY